MDETDFHMMTIGNRKGFALMVTLSVLSVIIALTLVLLRYFEEVQEDATSTKALLQANLYYSDITTLMGKIEDKKILFDILYESVLPLSSSEGDFSLFLQCAPLRKGVNINWLGLKPTPQTDPLIQEAQTLFERVGQEYNLQDVNRLFEILLEAIEPQEGFSTISKSRLHSQKGIIRYLQFEALLQRYQFEVDDSNVATVPWQDYFSFVPLSPDLKQEKIDIAYSSDALIAYLFELDILTLKQRASSGGSLEQFVNDNGGDYNAKKHLFAKEDFLDESRCFVGYEFGGNSYHFAFEYMKGKAQYFEFYGQE